MFNPLTIPFEAKIFFNVIKLKPQYTVEDVELALGEMCNIVKNTYRDEGGFIAGQVLKYSGFVSEEGSLGGADINKHVGIAGTLTEEHLIIATYWQSFEQHEESHADPVFDEKFTTLLDMCEDTFEIGYDILWQGEPE